MSLVLVWLLLSVFTGIEFVLEDTTGKQITQRQAQSPPQVFKLMIVFEAELSLPSASKAAH